MRARLSAVHDDELLLSSHHHFYLPFRASLLRHVYVNSNSIIDEMDDITRDDMLRLRAVLLGAIETTDPDGISLQASSRQPNLALATPSLHEHQPNADEEPSMQPNRRVEHLVEGQIGEEMPVVRELRQLEQSPGYRVPVEATLVSASHSIFEKTLVLMELELFDILRESPLSIERLQAAALDFLTATTRLPNPEADLEVRRSFQGLVEDLRLEYLRQNFAWSMAHGFISEEEQPENEGAGVDSPDGQSIGMLSGPQSSFWDSTSEASSLTSEEEVDDHVMISVFASPLILWEEYEDASF